MAWHDMARMYNCVYMYIDYMKQRIFRSLLPEYTVLGGGDPDPDPDPTHTRTRGAGLGEAIIYV